MQKGAWQAMKITLKDGSNKEYAQPISIYEIAADISEGLARAACAGEVDGKVEDLRTVIDKDCCLNILTANDEAGLRVIRHTASHVMAEAVKRLFPNAKVTIGPAIFQRRFGQTGSGDEEDHQRGA